MKSIIISILFCIFAFIIFWFLFGLFTIGLEDFFGIGDTNQEKALLGILFIFANVFIIIKTWCKTRNFLKIKDRENDI